MGLHLKNVCIKNNRQIKLKLKTCFFSVIIILNFCLKESNKRLGLSEQPQCKAEPVVSSASTQPPKQA